MQCSKSFVCFLKKFTSKIFPDFSRRTFGFPPNPLSVLCWWICGKLLPSRFRYLAVKQFTTKRIDKWKSQKTTLPLANTSTARPLPKERDKHWHFCRLEKNISKNYWLFPAVCVPCGLLQSRNVPVNWDNEKKTCTQKGTPSLSKAIRIVTPCLPGTSDGTHTSNRPITSFYSAAPTLLKSCLSPRSPGGLTISRYVLDWNADVQRRG